MDPSFDPYREWLGIPASEQPPNLYRLLGIQLLESDRSVIDRAADRVMLYLRTLSTGEYGRYAARLMSEVSSARVNLLDLERKAAYDASLLAATASPPPVAIVQSADVSPTPFWSATIEPVTSRPRLLPKSRGHADRKPNPSKQLASSILALVQIVFGGAGGLAIATIFMWISFGKDPLRLFSRSGPALPSKEVAKSGQSIPATSQAAGLPVVRHVKPAAPRENLQAPGKGPAPFSNRVPSARAANDESPSIHPPTLPKEITDPPSVRDPLVESVFFNVPLARALPPLGETGQTHPWLTLGRSSEVPLLLSLLDNAADLPESGKLIAVPATGKDHEWQLGYVVEGDRSANRKLATIRQDGARLLWAWETSANVPSIRDQLANCQMRLQSSDEERVVQLREPIELPHFVLDLYENNQTIEFPAENLPLASSLRFEVLGLTGFPGGPEVRNGVKSVSIGKQITLEFHDLKQAELGLRFFARSSSGKLVLQANPVFVESASREYELTFGRLEAARDGFEKAIQEAEKDFQSVQTELSNWQSRLQTLQANPPSGATEKALWDPQVGKAAGEVRRLAIRLSTLERKLAPLRLRLQAVPALQSFMNSLHARGAIKYRVVAECGDHDLVLISTTGDTKEAD